MTEPQAAVHSAQGIDISDFQPVWTGTPALDFLFAKATEGLTWESKTFAGNMAAARKAGIPFGAYHFLHPGLNGAAQARFFLDYVKRHGGLADGDMLAAMEALARELEIKLTKGLTKGIKTPRRSWCRRRSTTRS